MSLGEVTQISEGIYAYLQPDGSWWINSTGFLVSGTGDLLFNGGTPFALMGSGSGWIEVLETALRPLGARTLVAGHGPACGPEIIDDMLAYLRFVPHLARDAKAAGLTPLQAAREADLGKFKDLLDAERRVGNLHRAYCELDGGHPGAPVDLGLALGEMVAYHGPLTCHA